MLDRPKAITPDPDPESSEPSNAQSRNRKQTFFRAMLVLMVLGMAGFWIWAFSPLVKRGHPDNMRLPEYSEPAEQVCLQARARQDALPTDWDIDNPQELASQIKAVNLILDPMVAQLHQLVTRADVVAAASQNDQKILSDWLNHWETYLSDREELAGDLQKGQEATFTPHHLERPAHHRRHQALRRSQRHASLPAPH